jgi:peptidoglycan/xylan/chitin deacetylase (PgdA/CDA1 family)
MDGTAGLTMALATLEAYGHLAPERLRYTRDEGAITRMDPARKTIYLVFTGHEFSDGGDAIAKALEKHKAKGSFFFTGDFYRNPKHLDLIRRLVRDDNYLGGHSDKHLLYATWEKRDSSLVSEADVVADLADNYRAMAQFGLSPGTSPYFLPPYEWHNREVADYIRRAGLTLVNLTPGTLSNADYTTPSMGKSYRSSREIVNRILDFERTHPDGLNGFMLLMHVGTDPERTDKLYYRLGALMDELQKRGYGFDRLRAH